MQASRGELRLSRFAWGLLGYEILGVGWGAYVRATGSGAGCGRHWPMCNGEVIPRAPRIETLIELSHRLSSGGALIGTLAPPVAGAGAPTRPPGRLGHRGPHVRRGAHRRRPRPFRARGPRRLDEARAQHQPPPG